MPSFSREGVGVSAPAPLFFSKGEAAKKLLHELVKWWDKRYPHEVRRYTNEVRLLRETLRPGGMAKNKEIMQVMSIPVRINLMAEKLIPGFWKNGGRDLWQREFQNFRIKG